NRAAANTASSRNRKPDATLGSTPPANPSPPRNPAIRLPASTTATPIATPAAASAAGSRRTIWANVTGGSGGGGGCSRSQGGTAPVTVSSPPSEAAGHPHHEEHAHREPRRDPDPAPAVTPPGRRRALEGGFDLVGQQQLAGDFEVALGHIHADIAPGIDAVDRALES